MNKNEFVIVTKQIKKIELNSVGLISLKKSAVCTVYFIGKDISIKVKEKDLQVIDIYKTGKGFDRKICNICHILKPMECFGNNQTDAKGNFTTRPSCKDCRKNIDGVSLLKDEKTKMDAMKPQKGSIFICPVCEKRSIVGVTANLVRDHNHNTGKARDWLCDSCNTGLGRFKDDREVFKKIIEYLEKFDNN